MIGKNLNLGVLALTGIISVLIGGIAGKLYYQGSAGAGTSTELAELTTDEQKQAYSLGVVLGTQAGSTLSLNKDRISTDMILAGFKDKIDEKKLKLEDSAIRESLQQLQVATSSAAQTQMQAKKVELEAKALEKQAGLFGNNDSPQFGQGKITIVEFFDYNCSHCRALSPQLVDLVQADSDVRVLFRPVGIVSQGSQLATKAVLAAKKQNKFKEIHNAFMGEAGEINQEVIDKVIAKLSLDKAQFAKDLASEQVNTELKENMKIFMELGLGGVPSLFVAKLDQDNKISNKNLVYLLDYRPASIKEAVTQLK